MSWADTLKGVLQAAATGQVGDPHARYPMDERGPEQPGDYYPAPADDQPSYPTAAEKYSPMPAPATPDIPPPARVKSPEEEMYNDRAVNNPTVATPQPATSKAAKADPDNPIKAALATAFANWNRVNSQQADDEAQAGTYGHGTYAPGTMKKRHGLMVDVGGEQKKDSMISNIGKGLLMSMQRIAPIMLDKNVNDKTALGYAVGAGLFGGIGNAIAGNFDEKAKLAGDKAKASQTLEQAQAADTADTSNRYKDTLGEEAGTKNNLLERRVKTAENRTTIAERKQTDAEIDKFLTHVEKGSLDPAKNAEFMKLLGVRAGADLNVDVPKEQVAKVTPFENAIEKRGYLVVTMKDGSQVVKPINDPKTGEPLDITDSRYEQAKIQAQTQITTTGMRTTSAEKINSRHDSTNRYIIDKKLEQGDANAITDEMDAALGSDGGESLVDRYLQVSGSKNPDGSQRTHKDVDDDEFQQILDKYADTVIDRRSKVKASVKK